MNLAMLTRKLTDKREIERIYNERMRQDFPPNELKPLRGIFRAWDAGNYDCYVLAENEEILGYAFFARCGDNYLFDYLAIAKEHRGEGLGTGFLRQLSDCFQKAACILIEVEDPDFARNDQDRMLRERRLKFYINSGYRLTDVTASVFDVNYQILEVPLQK